MFCRRRAGVARATTVFGLLAFGYVLFLLNWGGTESTDPPAVQTLSWRSWFARSSPPNALHPLSSSEECWGCVTRRPAPAPESCHPRWVVVTSINPPTDAIRKLAGMADWRVVVVGDRKSPKDWSLDNCVFLDVDTQLQLGYETGRLLAFGHYARKNIGYLYAIEHGAQVIYETDDDNLWIAGADLDPLPPILADPLLAAPAAGNPDAVLAALNHQATLPPVVNPYAHFGQPSIWPRGYPLDAIASVDSSATSTATGAACTVVDAAAVGVQQGLANGDPDVDAIFRLTRKRSDVQLDIVFDPYAPPLAIATGHFAPFNSQNTFFHYKAFWGLLIPTTTTFRVCDIWRGYWTQRLLWDVDAYLVFTGPSVLQRRNPHGYLRDFVDEAPLYQDVNRLLNVLQTWRSGAPHFFDRVLELSNLLADHGFWGNDDAVLARAFLRDLMAVGYQPPAPVPANSRRPLVASTCVHAQARDLPTASLLQAAPPGVRPLLGDGPGSFEEVISDPKEAFAAATRVLQTVEPPTTTACDAVPDATSSSGSLQPIAPHFFKNTLLVVNFNWQNYLTPDHNLIALFDQLYTPFFYDVKYMGDTEPCPHCRYAQGLTLNRSHLLEFDTGHGFVVQQGLAHYVETYANEVEGVLYINDDILINPRKLVTLDKHRAWIAELSHNCTYDNVPPRPRCPWGRWDRTRASFTEAVAAMPPDVRAALDRAMGPDGYMMAFADFVYLPRRYFDCFVNYARYFWQARVMSELAMVITLKMCGDVTFLPFGNNNRNTRRAVRSFFDLVYEPSTHYFDHGLKFSHITPLNEIYMFRKLFGEVLEATVGPARPNVSRADPEQSGRYTRFIAGDGFASE